MAAATTFPTESPYILFVCTFKVWNVKLYTIMIDYMLLDFKDGRYKLKYDRMNLAIFIEALKEVFCIFRIWNCIWESCHPVLCPIQCETHLLLVRLERDLFNLAEKLPSLKRKNVHTSFCLKEFILQTFRTEWFIMRYNCLYFDKLLHWPKYSNWGESLLWPNTCNCTLT